MPNTLSKTRAFLKVVCELREKCPWDRKQTHQSLKPYLIEEAYEVIEAIDQRDPELLKEELGDLLLQIGLHAEIAPNFNFESVAETVATKMIARHPHVYGKAKVHTANQVLENWEKLKEKEKPGRTTFEGIPKALPALQLAQKYGKRAAQKRFDWEDVESVLAKLSEEIEELTVEVRRKKQKKSAIEMELGDVLFTLTNLARHLKIDSEQALRRSATKFAQRFRRLEKRLDLENATLDEMERVWQDIK